ncbi:response regulator [Phormidesmis sp. 146-12]
MRFEREDCQSTNNTSNCADALPLVGLQFLIVDDNLDTRALLTCFFQAYGADVVTVASVKDGLETLQQSRPDILISEICLPEEDGYSLIRRVRLLEAQRGETPILAIAVTTCTREEDRLQGFLAGFQGHFTKPVDLETLVKGVVDLLKATSKNSN